MKTTIVSCFSLFFVTLFFCTYFVHFCSANGNVTQIGLELNDLLVNELQIESIQTMIDNSVLESRDDSGISRVQDLSSRVAIRIREYTQALLEVSSTIETTYGDPRALTGTRQFVRSDNVAQELSPQRSEEYDLDVSFESDAVQMSSFVNEGSPDVQLSLFASENLLSTFQSNVEKFQSLRYQWFSSNEAFTRYYPAFQWAPQPGFDIRSRGWYSNTVAGPKTAIFVTEVGKSSQVAEAIHLWIDTFTSKDFIQIVAFDHNHIYIPECYTEKTQPELVRVSERNRAVFHDFVDEVISSQSLDGDGDVFDSDWMKKIFDTVFNVHSLNEFNDAKPNCIPSIVWLTIQAPGNTLRKYINSLNKKSLERAAIISLYSTRSLNQNNPDYNEMSHRIACDNDGIYSEPTSTELLQRVVSLWYLGLAQARRGSAIATASGSFGGIEVPVFTFINRGFYNDLSKIRGNAHVPPSNSQGLIVQLIRPLFSGRTIIGTFGMEFVLDDLEQIIRSDSTAQSVLMLTNNQGDALIHPNLNSPQNILSENFFDISRIERTPAFFNVRTSLVLRSSGTRGPIVALRDRPESATDLVLSTLFSYAPIPGSSLSVAIATPQDVPLIHLENLQSSSQQTYSTIYSTFITHYPDHIKEDIEITTDDIHGNQEITYSSALLSQSASSFYDVFQYLEFQPDQNNTLHLHNYLNDLAPTSNPGFQRSNKDHAKILSYSNIEENWINTYSDLMIYRRLTFFDGLEYCYPGVVGRSTSYDPRETDWFQRALILSSSHSPNPQISSYLIAVGAPKYHPDQPSASPYITISTTVQHSVSQTSALVASYDLNYEHFVNSISTATTQCSDDGSNGFKCVITNQQGDIISSPSVSQYFSNKRYDLATGRNIVIDHPEIVSQQLATSLFEKDIYTEYASSTTRERVLISSDYLSSQNGIVSGTTSGSCESGSYSIQQIEGTNLFLISLSASYQTSLVSCPDNGISLQRVSFTLDACEEVVNDFRYPVSSEHCITGLTLDSSSLDNFRDQYAECSDLDDYKFIEWIEWDDPIAIAMVTVTCISMFFVLILFVLIIINWNQPAIRTSSPAFLIVEVIGLLLLFSTVFFLTGKPTEHICRARAWFVALGFCIFFSGLFAKTYRIYALFKHMDTFQTQSITNRILFQYITVPILLEIILLILWSTIDSPDPNTIDDATDDDKLILQCVSDDQWLWQGLMIGFNAIFAGLGIFFAINTRNVATAFNESKNIAVCIYNIAAWSVIGIALGAALEEFNVAWYAILSASIILGGLVSAIALIVPKFWIIYMTDNNTDAYISNSLSKSINSGSTSGKTSGLTSESTM